jgi:hypothetical protein
MQSSTTDSRDGSLNAPRLEMPDASFRQGAVYALAYVAFVLALTVSAVWIWPQLEPWVWAHI